MARAMESNAMITPHVSSRHLRYLVFVCAKMDGSAMDGHAMVSNGKRFVVTRMHEYYSRRTIFAGPPVNLLDHCWAILFDVNVH